jgi:hypothetical protein
MSDTVAPDGVGLDSLVARLDSLVARVVDDFRERQGRGERPDPEEYAARHPEAAELLRNVLAALEVVGLSGSAAPATAAVGHRLGDYELLGEIGRGGMGVVFRARQISLGRLVAVKVILAADIASAEELWRLKREAETVARLEHPHIIPIYEAEVHQGLPYFSMPLMEGGSLVGQVARLSGEPRAAAEIVAAVAGAVHFAHERGVLHRDLKPANILLDAAGRPHVADFGLARRVDDTAATPSRAVIGTPAYMAPEQARGEKNLTPAADVYGLGATLYELLTGRPPFQAATPMDTLLQVIENNPHPPRRFNPRIDRRLEAVCLKCLEKEPRYRYPTAQALAEDLGRWLRGEPVPASRAGPVRRLADRARRRPLLVALGLLVLVSGAGGLALVQRSTDEARGIQAKNDATRRAAVQAQSDYVKVIQEVAAIGFRPGNQSEMGPLIWDPRAKELLDSCPPECRGLEWYCLKGLSRSPKWVYNAPPPDQADLKALASGLLGSARRPAGANRSDPGPPRVLLNRDEVVVLDSTRDGGRTVTCDLFGGTVRVRSADGWALSLPGVHVDCSRLPARMGIGENLAAPVPDESYQWLRRRVEVIEGESLSWYADLAPNPDGTRNVCVCDLRPGDD